MPFALPEATLPRCFARVAEDQRPRRKHRPPPASSAPYRETPANARPRRRAALSERASMAAATDSPELIGSTTSSIPAGTIARTARSWLGRQQTIALLSVLLCVTVFERAIAHLVLRNSAQFRQQDLSQLGIRIDEQPVVRRRRRNPLCHASPQRRRGKPKLMCTAKELTDVGIDSCLRRLGATAGRRRRRRCRGAVPSNPRVRAHDIPR